MTSNADDAAIVLAIITMARSLNMLVIAEGVETAAQQHYLRLNHCDQIQGYLISEPLSAESIAKFMLQYNIHHLL